ncbi:MAG: ATPase, T2SS/T4P/T4SS family [Verrucomicrobia bacterium]|nr:ATPase, T2SS/T4P/T4SS family [Verrucomicrobiota bacterium]MDA1066633.1 ATPase, T2SS/T4P/T4SS family [Verrucomicrobiota bacterium]
MNSRDEISLQLLVEKGVVVPEILDSLKGSIGPGESLIDCLIAAGHTTEEVVLGLLAKEFSLPLVDPEELESNQINCDPFDRQFLIEKGIILFDRTPSECKAAIFDPLKMDQLDDISSSLGLDLQAFLCSKKSLLNAINRFSPEGKESFKPIYREISESQDIEPSAKPSTVNSSSEDGAIVQYVHLIIKEALKRGASDIHLEPLEKRFRIRFRVDGVLQETENPPKRLQPAIISRIKLMSQMSIAEKRLPQDGRIQMDLHGRLVDFRVSSVPSAHGEAIVMRVLDKETLRLELSELGFWDDDKKLLEEVISKPDGIVLVTGPTGSGKSTTLYSFLNQLNKSDRKIITVEDPVEYQLSGINQVQVRSEIGMTFSAGLRAMLRQAPNIIMVGEIRDLETVEIAINASLTGHLVFSTLHTNDAPSAVSRLRDLGVAPFLISSSVRAIMAQRLVRRVCSECSEPVSPSAVDLASIEAMLEEAEHTEWREGHGCSACRGTGYRGRIGIFEIMTITPEMESLIYSNGSLADIRSLAREQGMRTMREDGLRKAIRGQTTISEILSATSH